MMVKVFIYSHPCSLPDVSQFYNRFKRRLFCCYYCPKGVIFCVVLLFGAAVVQHKISVVSAPKATVEIFCYKTLRALEIILILAL